MMDTCQGASELEHVAHGRLPARHRASARFSSASCRLHLQDACRRLFRKPDSVLPNCRSAFFVRRRSSNRQEGDRNVTAHSTGTGFRQEEFDGGVGGDKRNSEPRATAEPGVLTDRDCDGKTDADRIFRRLSTETRE